MCSQTVVFLIPTVVLLTLPLELQAQSVAYCKYVYTYIALTPSHIDQFLYIVHVCIPVYSMQLCSSCLFFMLLQSVIAGCMRSVAGTLKKRGKCSDHCDFIWPQKNFIHVIFTSYEHFCTLLCVHQGKQMYMYINSCHLYTCILFLSG